MAHNPGGGTSISTVQDQPDSLYSVPPSHSRRGSDALEATELARIRTNYSRATDSYRRAPSSSSQASPTGLWWWKYAIWKFWNSQISIIVPHVSCRDHLGMCALTISLTCHVRLRLASNLFKDYDLGMRKGTSVSHLMQLAPLLYYPR